MELIKIREDENKEKLVSARELYLQLGLDESNISRWMKKNIKEDMFFRENIDYVSNVFKTSGNNKEVTDYILKLETAKHVCMMARTEKAKEIRDYFIRCEKELSDKIKAPTSLKEALLLALEQQVKLEEQEALILENKPKVDFYDDVTESKDTLDLGSVAKVINRGIGRNKLFEFLRDSKILMQNNQPYQKYIDSGFFRTVETKFTKPNGDVKISIKTVVFQKGVAFINKMLDKNV